MSRDVGNRNILCDRKFDELHERQSKNWAIHMISLNAELTEQSVSVHRISKVLAVFGETSVGRKQILFFIFL